jgi:hypothetical protein
MGTPVTSAVSTYASGPNVVAATQMYGEWVVVHDNLSAATTGEGVLAPISYSSSNVHPLIINQGSLVRFVARYAYGTTTITTSPTIRVFGANQVPDSTTGAYPAGTIFWRIDANTYTGTSTTVTLALAASAQNDGSTYVYSSVSSHNGDNMHGAKSVLVLHDTAASISGGANTTVTLYAQVLNI